MNELKQVISQIQKSKQDKMLTYKMLSQVILKNQAQIFQKDLKNLESSLLLNFLLKKASKQNNILYFTFLAQFLEQIYLRKSSYKVLIYQIIPVLLTKYIQASEQKSPFLQNCLRVIFNNQFVYFNKNLTSKEALMAKSGQISSLYKQHFHSTMKAIGHIVHLSQMGKQEEINSMNRVSVKSVLLLTVFNNLESLSQKAIISYLWMVYVYCGGTQQQQQTGVSLYLLQKKNLFSIFKYYISVEQMSIILLTLYQLSMQRKKNKFELLSAINMIHKKAANQSMFKLSQVAQSTIHLLEDEYSDAFS